MLFLAIFSAIGTFINAFCFFVCLKNKDNSFNSEMAIINYFAATCFFLLLTIITFTLL